MIPAAEFRARRQALTEKVQGPIVLLGNGPRDRNIPGHALPFRQDSTLLYFTGCAIPDAAALLESGRFTLFLPAPGPEDALWHGPTPSLEVLGERFGADAVQPASALEAAVRSRSPRMLAVADATVNRRASEWTGTALRFGVDNGDVELADAVIALRRHKSAAELDEMREAARHSKLAHEAVMSATRPGGHERGLTALFEAVLAANGCTTGYGTILTQSGEILHNFHHDHPLEAGRMLLLDGGGEVASGYGVDITRSWPVDGRFDARQRAVTEAVLEAQLASIAACEVGVPYREVHDVSSRILARFLADEGLLRCDPDTAVRTGAHALFFPHGVGHHLGLDVHDLENFGDRPSYPPGVGRPEQFGTRNLRLNLPLGEGWVVTVEPGLYFVDEILSDAALRATFRDQVDFDRARGWLGFGGVRIEDDVHIAARGPEVLTEVVKDIDSVEALVGSGPSVEERLFAR